ncbi:MAG: hypothetical protein RL141_1039 [Candidatus Parcubacteria bacterium]
MGLFASIYLLIVYMSGAPIVCGSGHGCDAVRASEWAFMFGVIPRPLSGVAFYAGFLVLLVLRTAMPSWQTRWLYRLVMVGAAVGFAESLWLTWIQWMRIEAFCLWCLASGAAATVMFIASFGDRPVALSTAASLKELRLQFIAILVAFAVGSVALWGLL